MATAVKQGYLVTLSATEVEYSLDGPTDAEVNLVLELISGGSWKVGTGQSGGSPILGANHETVSSTGTKRLITVTYGTTLRMLGSGTVSVTW